MKTRSTNILTAHAVNHERLAIEPADLSKGIGHGLVPEIFWGPCMGQGSFRKWPKLLRSETHFVSTLRNFSLSTLILMGDWCSQGFD